jgi:hypothetical protein
MTYGSLVRRGGECTRHPCQQPPTLLAPPQRGTSPAFHAPAALRSSAAQLTLDLPDFRSLQPLALRQRRFKFRLGSSSDLSSMHTPACKRCPQHPVVPCKSRYAALAALNGPNLFAPAFASQSVTAEEVHNSPRADERCAVRGVSINFARSKGYYHS